MLNFIKSNSRIINMPTIGPVLFEKSKKAKYINISVRPSRIRVAVPKGVSYKQAQSFATIKINWIKKTLNMINLLQENSLKQQPINKHKGKLYLLNRLDELSNIHGFTYSKASIRNQKTRWGSCSVKNNISLNMQLMNLPHRLIDYVLLHELVHTRVKNHGPRFWNLLENFMPDAQSRNKELKKYILL